MVIVVAMNTETPCYYYPKKRLPEPEEGELFRGVTGGFGSAVSLPCLAGLDKADRYNLLRV